MDWTQIIILIITMLGGSTGLGYFLNWKNEKSKASALAKQEHGRGDEFVIANAEKLVNLFKKSLDDSQTAWEKERSQFITEIQKLENKQAQWNDERLQLITEVQNLTVKIDNQSKLISMQEVKIQEQIDLINTYVKEQIDLKKEVSNSKKEIRLLKNILANTKDMNLVGVKDESEGKLL